MKDYILPQNYPEVRISENALTVLKRRYLKKDNAGNSTETPEDMFYRVARVVAEIDTTYGATSTQVDDRTYEFYTAMANMDFLPNSPTMMNAGRELGQLSGCYVVPVGDSMEEIFDGIKNAAIIHKSGGGTGFSFTRLRAKNSAVKSTGGVASGPVSFMKVFNAATEAVKQGGTRRGANMGILSVHHQDIVEFITCKHDKTQLNNFNISVGITEEFMQAVFNNSDYNMYDNKGNIAGTKNANEIFNLIVDHAWLNGEPGIIFLDKINAANPTPSLGEIESTNPCGEQPLFSNEACNLGSLNLAHCVVDGKINWIKVHKLTRLGVRFLDNVIDANQYPLPIIDETTKSNRKIGLGVMGFADMLIQLGIAYNSPEAVKTARSIMECINRVGHEESEAIAKERGTFPNWEESIYYPHHPMRNATITTIAPTGTLSIIASASSGVEPLFALAYTKTVMDKDALVEVNPLFETEAKAGNFYSEDLMAWVAKTGSLNGIDIPVPDAVKKIYVTAQDMLPEWHVYIQAAFQEFTDNAVSKTINFPNSATKEEVAESYKLAHSLNCKGLTVYRDGSRDEQVLTIGSVQATETIVDSDNVKPEVTPRPRPETLTGITKKVKIGCGNLYVNVNSDDYGITEVFTNTGKAGGCSAQSEATSRLISIALRCGISIDTVVEQLKGIRCQACVRREGVGVTSCPDAIARTLKQYSKSISVSQVELTEVIIPSINICPECGQSINHESGCVTCTHCGYSKCG